MGTVACELANGSNTYIDMSSGNLSVGRISRFDRPYKNIYLDALCENSRFRTDFTSQVGSSHPTTSERNLGYGSLIGSDY